jgi:hypothetical protein
MWVSILGPQRNFVSVAAPGYRADIRSGMALEALRLSDWP